MNTDTLACRTVHVFNLLFNLSFVTIHRSHVIHSNSMSQPFDCSHPNFLVQPLLMWHWHNCHRFHGVVAVDTAQHRYRTKMRNCHWLEDCNSLLMPNEIELLHDYPRLNSDEDWWPGMRKGKRSTVQDLTNENDEYKFVIHSCLSSTTLVTWTTPFIIENDCRTTNVKIITISVVSFWWGRRGSRGWTWTEATIQSGSFACQSSIWVSIRFLQKERCVEAESDDEERAFTV